MARRGCVHGAAVACRILSRRLGDRTRIHPRDTDSQRANGSDKKNKKNRSEKSTELRVLPHSNPNRDRGAQQTTQGLWYLIYHLANPYTHRGSDHVKIAIFSRSGAVATHKQAPAWDSTARMQAPLLLQSVKVKAPPSFALHTARVPF